MFIRTLSLWTMIGGSVVLLTAADPAGGQTLRERGLRPVDQVVEDVDPLSRSLRDREAGLRATGQFNTVYRPVDPKQSDRYFHIAQGVTAEYRGRSLYSQRRDPSSRRSVLVQDIPPDTVFHIGRPDVAGKQSDESFDPPRSFVDAQVHPDSRQDRRVHRARRWRGSDQPVSSRAERAAQSRAAWRQFHQQTRQQWHTVAALLEPAAQSTSQTPERPASR